MILSQSVLIVDDEQMTRSLLRMMLQREDYRIYEAGDGVEALTAVHQYRPDLILLDVMMPNMDGLTVCKRLREDVKTADMPIILLSAKTQSSAIREGLQAGADLYLTKPVPRDVLLQNIQELLPAAAVTAVSH
ncbi:MAG TPA: response regulator [Anaerolineae bacterium]|nr:response regulator [Anaerolineae bacterium]HIP73242.1 response regulator [Anaerolineae bacterium]